MLLADNPDITIWECSLKIQSLLLLNKHQPRLAPNNDYAFATGGGTRHQEGMASAAGSAKGRVRLLPVSFCFLRNRWAWLHQQAILLPKFQSILRHKVLPALPLQISLSLKVQRLVQIRLGA